MEHVDPTIFRLAIFVLAIFVGYYVVWSVTPALHTPLMAVTNAISSVIIVGGLIAAAAVSGDVAGPNAWIAKGAGVLAVTLASVNIFGGFMVTRRMLAMYKKKERPAKVEAAILALAGALVFVATSGRLSADTRRRIELGLIVVFYPVFTIFMGWRAFDYAVEQRWLPAIVAAGFAAFLGADGYQKFRVRLRTDRIAT